MRDIAILFTFLLFAALWLWAIDALRRKSSRSRGDDRHRYARTAVSLEMIPLAVIVVCCLLVGLLLSASPPSSGSARVVLLAIALPCTLLLVTSIIRWRELRSEKHYRRLYKREPGFCGRCGYDLTGNISGVCPECGWKPPDNRKHGSAEG